MSSQEFQRQLNEQVFPPNWVNPEAKGEYDLLVIGGGPGGMTAAITAQSLGARTALVEKEHLGGECFNYGCIPSKAFLHSSRLAKRVKEASEYGVEVSQGWKVEFKKVIQRVHALQLFLAPNDSVTRLKNLGLDLFLGEGRFTGRREVEVAGQKIRFKKAIISTGTQPIPLNVPGIGFSDYLTNQNVFNLSELPRRLAVFGAGPIGCELSQAFLHLGSEVYLITRGTHLLPRDDEMASERLQNVFEKEGMKLLKQTKLLRVEKKGKEKLLYLDSQKEPLVVDEILVAIGRKPAVESLNLESGQVTYDLKSGIQVDDYLKTTNPDIYGAGDSSSRFKFTHLSIDLNKIAVNNALNGDREKASALVVPWATYTEPEVAHIGLQEAEVKALGIPFEVVTIEMSNVDRAILDGETVGFAKLIVREGEEQILGATIMAAHAGEMISELSVAMNSVNGLTSLLKAIHPFPTQSQVLRMAAEALVQKRKSYASAASRR